MHGGGAHGAAGRWAGSKGEARAEEEHDGEHHALLEREEASDREQRGGGIYCVERACSVSKHPFNRSAGCWRMLRVSLAALVLPALVRSEDYVAFQALSNTNLPPARALSATVLQHTVSANAALGR